MAILNKDEFFNRIHSFTGTDTSEESISFIEDMTDTYNDFENKINNNGTDWEQKYNELDKAWREKYRHRFFTGTSAIPAKDKEDEQEDHAEEITIDELFK